MEYDQAVKHYIELRDANASIKKESDAKIAENKEKMEQLAVFLQLKAEHDKLEKIPTKYGLVFWTVGARCNLSNSDEFFKFVVEHEAWELLEKRASKVGVGDYIKTHKVVPPGVDYVTIKQINVRAK